MKKSIAERELLYSLKGDDSQKKLVVRISEPYLVDESMVNFKFDPGTAGCKIEFVGLPEEFIEEVHGADSIQALSFATDIDPYLRRLEKNYDFYWQDSSPYFDK